jgi:hypothetical protein
MLAGGAGAQITYSALPSASDARRTQVRAIPGLMSRAASPRVHHGLMTGSRESGGSADPVRLAELLDALDAYRRARERLLHVLSLPMSNRDPLAEVSEHLVLALVGGTMAVSRVQKGYDLTAQSGDRVQVRYLANVASVGWVNEHCVRSGDGFDLYALVLYEH